LKIKKYLKKDSLICIKIVSSLNIISYDDVMSEE